MAKRWSAVTRSCWTDAKFLLLSGPNPNAQTLWLYLLTSPHQGPVPGVLRLGIGAIADDLGWEPKTIRKLLSEIEHSGMLYFCDRPALIFLPNAITHNQPANPNIIKSWKSHWSNIPECPLRDQALFILKRSIRQNLHESFAHIFFDELKSANGRPVDPSHSPKAPAFQNETINGSANGSSNSDQDQDHIYSVPTSVDSEPEAEEKKPVKRIATQAVDLAEYLREQISTHSPDYAENKVKDSTIRSWALLIDRMIRLDKANPEEIKAIIRWAHVEDPSAFWQPNLLSASSLRKQYARLLLQAKKAGAIQRMLDEGTWKTEYGSWAIRVGQRTATIGGSFDGSALMAAARLEGVPTPDPTAAHRIANWAVSRA